MPQDWQEQRFLKIYSLTYPDFYLTHEHRFQKLNSLKLSMLIVVNGILQSMPIKLFCRHLLILVRVGKVPIGTKVKFSYNDWHRYTGSL